MINDSHKLLTEEAKINKIKNLLPVHGRHGRFFIPDDLFYAPPADDLGLWSQAKQICTWVGFKPVGLHIYFSQQLETDASFINDNNGPAIVVHSRYRHNPFATGALLTQYLMRYYFHYRKGVVLDDEAEQQAFDTLATIYSGLGIVALNRVTSYWQEHYPKLYFWLCKTRSNGILIADYVNLVNRFLHEYRLDLNSYKKYLCPWAITFLPAKKQSTQDLAGFVKKARERSRGAYATLAGSLLIAVFGMAMSGYVLSQRPASLSPAQRQARENIAILKSSYELCNQSVLRKQKAYDQTDFFIERNLEADRLRCASIRNNYNYQVDQYNARLNK